MKIGPMNIILELVNTWKVNTKTHVAETVPSSCTLPLQTVPDPCLLQNEECFYYFWGGGGFWNVGPLQARLVRQKLWLRS